jgi:hypothetical protein
LSVDRCLHEFVLGLLDDLDRPRPVALGQPATQVLSIQIDPPKLGLSAIRLELFGGCLVFLPPRLAIERQRVLGIVRM